MKRRILLVGLPLVLAALGAGLFLLRPRPAPARDLFKKLVPDWQAALFRPPGSAGTLEARRLLAAANRWPALHAELTRIDQAWPDETAVRAATEAANRAARAAGLGYYLDVQLVRQRPILLSYEVAQRTTFRAGERSVELLRVRRLDSLNIELVMLGETQGDQPRVLLDRIEASLVRELPLMFQPRLGASAVGATGVRVNDADVAALRRLRAHLEARLGAAELAEAVEKLRRREELVESMRARFHKGSVQLSRPDGFVLGEAWFETMEPYTRLDRPGGPLMLDTDLRQVRRADEDLRDGPVAEVLRRAVAEIAASTDVHEVRHALDAGPPAAAPERLAALFSGRDERFPRLASLELRAYLAELHHGALPPCVTAAKLLRNVFGAGARPTPHYYAGFLILIELMQPAAKAGTDGAGAEAPVLTPAARLDVLCALPEPQLRDRAAALWQALYGEPIVAAAAAPVKAP